MLAAIKNYFFKPRATHPEPADKGKIQAEIEHLEYRYDAIDTIILRSECLDVDDYDDEIEHEKQVEAELEILYSEQEKIQAQIDALKKQLTGE